MLTGGSYVDTTMANIVLIHTALSFVASLPLSHPAVTISCDVPPSPKSKLRPQPPLSATASPRFPPPTHTHSSYAPTMADDSDSSGLSEHSDKEIQKLAPIFVKAKKATKLAAPPPAVSPPRPKRPPSPPHEDVFADNPDIAVRI